MGRGTDDTCVRRLMERAGAGRWFRPADPPLGGGAGRA
jgi:hypothetical protein